MGQSAWVFRADGNVFLTARESLVGRTTGLGRIYAQSSSYIRLGAANRLTVGCQPHGVASILCTFLHFPPFLKLLLAKCFWEKYIKTFILQNFNVEILQDERRRV